MENTIKIFDNEATENHPNVSRFEDLKLATIDTLQIDFDALSV